SFFRAMTFAPSTGHPIAPPGASRPPAILTDRPAGGISARPPTATLPCHGRSGTQHVGGNAHAKAPGSSLATLPPQPAGRTLGRPRNRFASHGEGYAREER